MEKKRKENKKEKKVKNWKMIKEEPKKKKNQKKLELKRTDNFKEIVTKQSDISKLLTDYTIYTMHIASIGGNANINCGPANTDFLTHLLESRRLLPCYIINEFDDDPIIVPSNIIVKGGESVIELYHEGDIAYVPEEFNRRLLKKPARETMDTIHNTINSYFGNMMIIHNDQIKDKSIYWMTLEDLAGFYFKSIHYISGSNQENCTGFHIDSIIKPRESMMECHLSDAFIEGRLTLEDVEMEEMDHLHEYLNKDDFGINLFNLDVGLTFVYGMDYKLKDLIIHAFYMEKNKRRHLKARIIKIPDLLMLEVLHTKCFISTKYDVK